MAWPPAPTAGLFHAVGDRFFIGNGAAWVRYYGGWYEVADVIYEPERWSSPEAFDFGGFVELIHI